MGDEEVTTSKFSVTLRSGEIITPDPGAITYEGVKLQPEDTQAMERATNHATKPVSSPN